MPAYLHACSLACLPCIENISVPARRVTRDNGLFVNSILSVRLFAYSIDFLIRKLKDVRLAAFIVAI